MKTSIVVAASFVAALAAAANAALVVTELQAQTTAGTASTINGDWWELTNTGAASINLAGYQWADTEDALGGPTPQPNFFPAITIAAGESIIILEEAAANEAAFRTNWNLSSSVQILGTDEMLPSPGVTDTFSGLSSNGDGVFFYSPAGDLLSSYTYGAITRGTTFEADRSGNNLGLSVIGENGAYRAANNDIGSPATSVPAPGAVALSAVALAGLRRRRSA
ncbi:MAG: lamin tail domain-containing protein [Planctomycetota bacterium]|nr:lamin tail domain-containing protein [Planctomycetota bacterium]